MVVAIMNQARVAKTFRLTLPAGYATARDFFTVEAVTPGAEVTVELARGDARAWVLAR